MDRPRIGWGPWGLSGLSGLIHIPYYNSLFERSFHTAWRVPLLRETTDSTLLVMPADGAGTTFRSGHVPLLKPISVNVSTATLVHFSHLHRRSKPTSVGCHRQNLPVPNKPYQVLSKYNRQVPFPSNRKRP